MQQHPLTGGAPPGALPEESMEILEISASLPLAQYTQPAAPWVAPGQGGTPPAVFANSNPFAADAPATEESKLSLPSPGPVAESAAQESSSMMGGFTPPTPGTDSVFGWPDTGAASSSGGDADPRKSNRHRFVTGRQPSDASEEAAAPQTAQGSQGFEFSPYTAKVTGKSQWRNEFT